MSLSSDGECQSCVKAVCEFKFHQLTGSYFVPDMFFIQVAWNKNKSGHFPVCMLCISRVSCGNKTFLLLHFQILYI